MAKIEVDEEEYARSKRVFDTLAKIVSDPKRKAKLEALHKEVDPSVPTPTIEAEKAILEPVEAVRKEFDAYKKQQEEKETKALADRQQSEWTANWNSGQSKLKARGYTPEAIAKFEEDMAQKGITDHELYADAWEKRNPTPPPAMPGGTGSWNFLELPTEDKDVDIKRLIEQTARKESSDSVADKMAISALNEFRGAVGRR
jgi:hypothetical protein